MSTKTYIKQIDINGIEYSINDRGIKVDTALYNENAYFLNPQIGSIFDYKNYHTANGYSCFYVELLKNMTITIDYTNVYVGESAKYIIVINKETNIVEDLIELIDNRITKYTSTDNNTIVACSLYKTATATFDNITVDMLWSSISANNNNIKFIDESFNERVNEDIYEISNTVYQYIGSKEDYITIRNYSGNTYVGIVEIDGSINRGTTSYGWYHCKIRFKQNALIRKYINTQTGNNIPYAVLFDLDMNIKEVILDEEEFERSVDYDGYIIVNVSPKSRVDKLTVEVYTEPYETFFYKMIDDDCYQDIDISNYLLLNTFVDKDGNIVNINTNDSWGTYMFVPVNIGANVIIDIKSQLDPNLSYVAYFDIHKKFINSVYSSEQSLPKYNGIAENDGYVCIIYSRGSNSNAFIHLYDRIKGVVSLLENRVNYLEEHIKSYNQFDVILSSESFKCIYKFGVIGDSLATGHMTNAITNELNSRNLKFGWGEILARKNNQTCLTFGFSGATATSWFTNKSYSPAEHLVIPENLCQCYIIGLGANDDAGGVGTIDDIDWDNGDNNAATFCGLYARIIQLIRKTAPDALIFCLTLPYPRTSTVKNDIIKQICEDEHISSNTFVVDLVQYNDILKEYIVGESTDLIATYDKYYYKWHFTAGGYALCAKLIEYAISKVMDDNANKPSILNIGFIPYGTNEHIE